MKLTSRQVAALALTSRGYSRVGKLKLTLETLHLPWHFRISQGHKNSIMGAVDVWITDRGHMRVGVPFTASRPIPRPIRAILLAEGRAHHAAFPPVTTLEALGL